MIYPFKCPDCKKYDEVWRSMKDAHLPLVCECGQRMNRKYTVPQVSVPKNSGYYNHGLGRYIHHKSDVRDAINEVADGGTRDVTRRDPDTNQVYQEKVEVPGREIVPVGDDKGVRKAKPVRQKYTIPREVLAALPGD